MISLCLYNNFLVSLRICYASGPLNLITITDVITCCQRQLIKDVHLESPIRSKEKAEALKRVNWHVRTPFSVHRLLRACVPRWYALPVHRLPRACITHWYARHPARHRLVTRFPLCWPILCSLLECRWDAALDVTLDLTETMDFTITIYLPDSHFYCVSSHLAFLLSINRLLYALLSLAHLVFLFIIRNIYCT